MLYFVPLVIVDIFVIEAASGTMAVIKIAVLEQDLEQIIKLDNILSGCYYKFMPYIYLLFKINLYKYLYN